MAKRKGPSAPSAGREPKRRKTSGSKTNADGDATRNTDNDFFNDEDVWIKIYYTLLLNKATSQTTMLIPPTTDILLLFDAYFQGFKEPIGKASLSWNDGGPRHFLLECDATPTRTRRNLVDFEIAVQRICPELKEQIDELRLVRLAMKEKDKVSAEASSLFVAPEQIRGVLDEAGMVDEDGKLSIAALERLTSADTLATEEESWSDRALAHIKAPPVWTEKEERYWNPEGLSAKSLRAGPELVKRHEDAASAQAMINACPVPPLGFFGDLKTLKAEDFNGDYYDDSDRALELKRHKEQVELRKSNRDVVKAKLSKEK